MVQDENSCVCQVKPVKTKKCYVYKVKSNRKALSALSTCELAPRLNAPLHSSKITFKRSAFSLLKNAPPKVSEYDPDDLDFDKLSVTGEKRSGNTCFKIKYTYYQ